MSGPTNGNGRDEGNAWVESLLMNAGAGVGRVLDDRQVHAVNLAIEVFAYLLAALPSDQVDVRDVIRALKCYSRGVNDAKSSKG